MFYEQKNYKDKKNYGQEGENKTKDEMYMIEKLHDSIHIINASLQPCLIDISDREHTYHKQGSIHVFDRPHIRSIQLLYNTWAPGSNYSGLAAGIEQIPIVGPLLDALSGGALGYYGNYGDSYYGDRYYADPYYNNRSYGDPYYNDRSYNDRYYNDPYYDERYGYDRDCRDPNYRGGYDGGSPYGYGPNYGYDPYYSR